MDILQDKQHKQEWGGLNVLSMGCMYDSLVLGWTLRSTDRSIGKIRHMKSSCEKSVVAIILYSRMFLEIRPKGSDDLLASFLRHPPRFRYGVATWLWIDVL